MLRKLVVLTMVLAPLVAVGQKSSDADKQKITEIEQKLASIDNFNSPEMTDVMHEVIEVEGSTLTLEHGLLHYSYPNLSDYIGHMNRYSSLGAEMAAAKGQRGNAINIVVRPWLTFLYNYFFRLGFLDGREGFLLHLYHAAYVSWKYAKLWELRNHKGR